MISSSSVLAISLAAVGWSGRYLQKAKFDYIWIIYMYYDDYH